MTRDQIASKVQTRLNDFGVKITPADLNDSIQDGYFEVTALTGCIFKAASISTSANLSYYDFGLLIPDFFAVTAIFNPTIKRWMVPVSLRQLEEIRNDWELAIGNPYLFWPINFRYVAIYPKLTTSTGSLYAYYRAQADVLTGTSTPQIPDSLQSILEEYTTGDLLEQSEEFTKAGISLTNYFKDIQELKQATRTIRMPDLISRLA
jgi:hypothetical protein